MIAAERSCGLDLASEAGVGGVAIASNGDILAAGWSCADFGLARYRSDRNSRSSRSVRLSCSWLWTVNTAQSAAGSQPSSVI